ncbi:MAG: ABC transporter permease [Candidatus Cloacimonetes bacterium]|nr:ABC transporter permease [Candidatus Cloacimonadota bacterium]
MLKNYFKVAFRNIVRHKAFSFINITGLAIGLICFILIMMWIQDEMSFDNFHQDADRIFITGLDYKIGNQEGRGIKCNPPLAPAMMAEIPEIESATRFLHAVNKLVTYKDNDINFLENGIFYADSTIFNVFTIPLITGDPTDLLTRKNTLVITQEMAQKYFGDLDPIGKTLSFDGDRDFEVVGVVEAWPAKSHWHFDMLASLISTRVGTDESWWSNYLYTYFKIREGTNIEAVLPKINEMVRRKKDVSFAQIMGMDREEWEAAGNRTGYYATPLKDIYLRSTTQDNVGKVGDIRYVYLFAVIGFFILFVACINFMNITTARSAIRAKEIGMRKVFGSSKRSLIRQFLMESILITFCAMFIAVVFIEILMPYFNNFTDKALNINFAGVATIPILLLMVIVVGLMSGGYSAVSLASFKILSVLKGSLFSGKNKTWFRNALVLFQFSVSILVIVCTIIAYNQMNYLKNKKLGFDKEQLLIIDRASTIGDDLPTFKEELLKNTAIQYASATYHIPGTEAGGQSFRTKHSAPEELLDLKLLCGDYDYLDAMGINLVAGRYFSEEIHSDDNSIVVNATAVKRMGFTDAIGKKILEPNSEDELTIIGVVEDFHISSLHKEIAPLILLQPGSAYDRYLAVRIRPQNVAATLEFIEAKWNEFSGDQPFEYFFMDSFFDNLHKSEQRTGQFFTIFAALAIFIACLGLFGLAAFTAEQKTKEIGVRKVLGASVASIVSILLKQFTKWVVLANIIAWPIGYFIMKSWLQNFAYHIDLKIEYFILSGLITLLIAIATVSYLAVNAANKNPVKALNYE